MKHTNTGSKIVAFGLALACAMPVIAQTTPGTPGPTGTTTATGTTGTQGTIATTNRRDDDRDWGWIGLLGLAGLAGLMRRPDTRDVDRSRTTAATPR